MQLATIVRCVASCSTVLSSSVLVLITRSPLLVSPPTFTCESPVVSSHDWGFFTGHVSLTPDLCIYDSTILLKLVRFSYAYMLSLYICDYFSRKLLAKFEFPYLKARYVLFFHRKEFRRKGNKIVVEFLNHLTTRISFIGMFKCKLSLNIYTFSFIISNTLFTNSGSSCGNDIDTVSPGQSPENIGVLVSYPGIYLTI